MKESIAQQFECDDRIWHDRPAGEDWLRALPIGNGRMGAMVFGNPGLERIQLNEDTFYALEPEDCCHIPSGIPQALPGVIELLRRRKFAEAEAEVARHWLGRSNAPYLPLADLWIDFSHAGFSGYAHTLSLAEAVISCRYAVGGKSFMRETFMSYPDQVLALRLSCDAPASISFSVWLDSPHRATLRARIEGGRFVIRGQGPGEALRRPPERIAAWGDERKYPNFYQQNPDGSWSRRPGRESNVLYGDAADGKGMFFEAQLQVLSSGGRLSERNGRLCLEGADEAVLLLSADTSFNGMHKSPSREGVEPSAQAAADLDAASRRTFSELKQRHVADVRPLYERAALRLGAPGPLAGRPADERVARYREGRDPTLPALLFNFSRYLMIAASRPGSQPLNLQGLWNQDLIPAWNGAYTTNINAEMNYWGVLRGHLEECHEPFLRMVRETWENGKKVAAKMFGYRGWCLFHNISIWRSAAPVDGAAHTSWWPVGAGWFCQHIWHHYLHTEDRDFLREHYPILRDAALFFCDWLADRGDGVLVTPVSTSPENRFRYPDAAGAPREAGVCMGSTMDMAIIRETFANTLAAAERLGIVEAELGEIRAKRDRLLDYRIAANGALMEWSEDFEETEPEHRHLSHLYGFFPGEEITPEKRPELINAVRAALERRGDGGPGWSIAWKLNCWARLGDGERVERLLFHLLTPERTAPNLLNLHPPFQIDGNFGAGRGIAEALLQDHRGFIHLLPALPPTWKEGFFRGLKCRGGAEVDLEWREGSPTRVAIRSRRGGVFLLRYREAVFTVALGPGEDRSFVIPEDFSSASTAREGCHAEARRARRGTEKEPLIFTNGR